VRMLFSMPVKKAGTVAGVRYLRVSVTERCTFRCLYCSPSEPPRAAAPQLSAQDIERVVRVARRSGVRHVRLTGGEPLERPDIIEIVARIGRLTLPDLSLTTNGARLAELAPQLRQAGLHRVNVSLPHAERTGFARITGTDALERVLAGVQAAKSAGLAPVKTNTVLLRGYNDDAVEPLAELARTLGVVVRFIEYMAWETPPWPGVFVPAAEVLTRLRRRLTLAELPPQGTNGAEGPARYYRTSDGGIVGVITPVTEPFCGRCNRLRLSAAGKLRPCLYGEEEVDLRPALQAHTGKRALEEGFTRAMALKPTQHANKLSRRMRLTGG